MSQWGQAQPGYQYPLQTGFQPPNSQFQQNPQFQQQNPQFQQQNPQQQGYGGGILPQPTGFPGQRPQGFQQSQPTGFPGPGPGPSGFLQPQQTGFPGPTNFQRQPPPVPPIPSQFQQQNQGSGFLGPIPQANRFLSPSPGLGGSGLAAQPTGFGGRSPGGPLVPQMTGFVDPRLQMMSSTFLPANSFAPYSTGGGPQLLAQPLQNGLSLEQSFQQHNQAQRGTAAPKVPWALSKAEKKSYDQIFRAWDNRSTGFISGATALEVFGQSGLPKDDLARIWTLADIDDRGKLNMAEFHVAMGLIYRRLNGNDIPEQLPAELVPPSARDLDTSVTFLKDILKNETRSRSPSNVDAPLSYAKQRSLNRSSPSLGAGRDATVYKHSEAEPPGGFYQPRSRHVDRSAVRSRTDGDSPTADLNDLKWQLENTAKMLDRAVEADASRTAEDDELDREMSDLRFRVKRVQEDLEYASRGPRSSGKDEERRRLERELLKLLHERLPEVERKVKDREARKEREKREWQRDRDRRNERFGKYDAKEDSYSSQSRSYRDRDEDADRDRYRYDRDERSYSRNRSRDRDYERKDSAPPSARSPPPAPPSRGPPSSIGNTTPPKPSTTPAPIKNMTKEERQAYAREEAQRRIQARMQALGVVAPSASPSLDSSVEDRLIKEKKEAEEKVRLAEEHAQERERLRQERLAGEKAIKEAKTTPAPTPTVKAPTAAPPAPTATPKAAPPPPKPRTAPAPPPPRRATGQPRADPSPRTLAPAPVPAPPVVSPAPPPPPPAPVDPEVDPEEEMLRAREEALRKKREARAERLRQLEAEEEEARLAEEQYKARRTAFLNATPASPPAAPATAPIPAQAPPAPPAPVAPQIPQASPAPPAPPAPPALPTAQASVISPIDKSSTNPFSRMLKEGGGVATPPAATVTPATGSSTNPFFRSQTAPPPATPAAPAPSKSPVPAAVKTSYNTAPDDTDSDWDQIKEIDDDEDSSDDDVTKSRDTRTNIAQTLFGSLLPRPQSAAASTSAQSPKAATPVSAPPAPPLPPPAPAAPNAPLAPSPANVSAPPAGQPPAAGDVSALMASIQGGLKLRKAVTIDKSAPPVSGKVLGDTAPPAHINAAPRPVSPPLPAPTSMAATENARSNHRQSVDWYAGLAADQQAIAPQEHLPTTIEEDETEYNAPPAAIPNIQVVQPLGEAEDDPMADVDMSTEHRVRTLYPYEGQRVEDLTFQENFILTAHPSKTGGDWWYGTLLRDGKSGFFPNTYVQAVEHVKATALYGYAGNNPDELSFAEGDVITIVDRSEDEWWKAEQGGVVFIVPAAYLEVVEAAIANDKLTISDGVQTTSPVAASFSEGEPPVPGDTEHHVDTSESDDDSDTSSYLSFDETPNEDDNGGDEAKDAAERGARERERRLVLEAAGLIVNQDVKPPPRPKNRRRPAPVPPERSTIISNVSAHLKELPPVPEPDPVDHAMRLDDAFDRYESFRHTHGAVNNRLSTASTDTVPPSPTVSSAFSSASITPSPSRDPESRGYSHFLGFLGRKTPVDHEKRTIPYISAPILNKTDTPSRENSPAFGTSWASLVDKTALEGIPSSERRRQEAIFELITTEAAYVRDLQLIVEIFYSSMLPLLDRKGVTVVFANVEDILLTNTTFLSSLEERQKECRLYIDRIGDILKNHMANMGVYLEYCVNQSTAINVLSSLRASNSELASHLQRLRDEEPAVRNLDLSSYLLAPMQRITRYPLLIKQILHHTETVPERTEIEKALHIAEKLLEHINETIREQEGSERLKVISEHLWIGQGRLDLTAPTRYMGPRRLLKEGVLLKAKSGRKLRAFLCSDIMVLTDDAGKTLYRLPIPLAEVQVKEVPGKRDDHVFQLAMAYPRGGETITLRATSVRDCQVWMIAIETASRKCLNSEKRAVARKQSRT